MGVCLSKGERINLTKDTNLKKAMLGLGWDIKRYEDGADYDLDLVIFMCDKDYRCIDEKHFVFYHNLKGPNNSVIHSGDNRTGAGDGDDETALINFEAIPPKVERVVVAVTIYEARKRKQNFGAVENSFIRMENAETGEEILRYDLCEEFSTQTSVIFGEIYKYAGEWKFNAIGSGYNKELADLCREYGIDVKE